LLKNTTSLEGAEALEHLWIDLPAFYFWMAEQGVLKFRYEKAAFISTLKLNENKLYIPFGGIPSSLNIGDTLTQRTDFEKFSAFVEVQQDIHSTWGFGYYLLKYRKPYSATIGGEEISQTILDSKFSSDGFVILLSKHSPVDATKYIGFTLRVYYGEGDIQFSESQSINDALSPFETTALILIRTEVETRIAITENLRFGARLGYENYDFHRAKKPRMVFNRNQGK